MAVLKFWPMERLCANCKLTRFRRADGSSFCLTTQTSDLMKELVDTAQKGGVKNIAVQKNVDKCDHLLDFRAKNS